MRAKKKEERLPAREGKLLAAVLEISQEGFDPSPTAVAMLLRGEEPASRFSYLRTFGSLTSLSAKKIKALVTLLRKHGLLTVYAPLGLDEQYLLLTPEGEKEAVYALSRNIRKNEVASRPPLFHERN